MLLITEEDALCGCQALFSAIYGEDVVSRWCELKYEMGFSSEREYMMWMLDVACQCRDTEQQTASELIQETGREVDPCSSSGDTVDYKARKKVCDLEVDQDGYNMADAFSPSTCQIPCVDLADNDAVDLAKTSSFSEPDCRSKTSEPEDYFLSNEHYDESLSDTSNKKYHCPYCSYGTNYKGNLTAHLNCRHEKKRKYVCPHCNHSANMKQHIEYHLIMKHGYKSKFSCTKCDRNFPYKQVLLKHLPTCTGAGSESLNT